MKFCSKCGKELFDEAVICVGCGCPVQIGVGTNFNKEIDEAEIQKRKKNSKRIIIIVTAVICVLVALLFASVTVVNSFKSNIIIEELSGEKFECNEDTSYSIDRDSYAFDDEGNCVHNSYYYGITMDNPLEFTFDCTYEIQFMNNSAYVLLSNDKKFKIKYGEEGEIISLYDFVERKTYERK